MPKIIFAGGNGQCCHKLPYNWETNQDYSEHVATPVFHKRSYSLRKPLFEMVLNVCKHRPMPKVIFAGGNGLCCRKLPLNCGSKMGTVYDVLEQLERSL